MREVSNPMLKVGRVMEEIHGEALEIDGYRFVFGRDPDVFEYAGRTDGPEDSPGLLGWEFRPDELAAMRETAANGGHVFRDGKIGEELDRLAGAMRSYGRARQAEKDLADDPGALVSYECPATGGEVVTDKIEDLGPGAEWELAAFRHDCPECGGEHTLVRPGASESEEGEE